MDELFTKTAFLGQLLKREEVLKERITNNEKGREVFEKTLRLMAERRILNK